MKKRKFNFQGSLLILLFATIFFYAFAGWALYIGVENYNHQKYLLSVCKLKIKANITGKSYTHSGDRYYETDYFEYELDGKKYTFSDTYTTTQDTYISNAHRLGDEHAYGTIDIYVNPDNHEEWFRPGGIEGAKFKLTVPVVMFFLGSLFFGLFLFLGFRKPFDIEKAIEQQRQQKAKQTEKARLNPDPTPNSKKPFKIRYIVLAIAIVSLIGSINMVIYAVKTQVDRVRNESTCTLEVTAKLEDSMSKRRGHNQRKNVGTYVSEDGDKYKYVVYTGWFRFYEFPDQKTFMVNPADHSDYYIAVDSPMSLGLTLFVPCFYIIVSIIVILIIRAMNKSDTSKQSKEDTVWTSY